MSVAQRRYRKRASNANAKPKARAVASRPAYRRPAPPRKRRQVVQKAQGSLGRTALEEGGSMIGGLFGMPGLGKMAGNALANIVGLGSYEVKENIFMEGRLPQVMNIPSGGGTVIRFQEYLTDIYTTSNVGNPAAFNIQSFFINPANVDTFPWLSQIAANYEQYQIEGLLFEFKSTSADALNSTNSALGSVMMATQYDSLDTVFRTKAEMLNYEYSVSGKPSDNLVHMIECAPTQSTLSALYTLDGAVPTGADARFYHLGRFSIATVGFQAASVNIGQLHITYQVRLMKPKLYSTIGLASDYAVAQVVGASAYTNAQPIPQTNFIGNFAPVISGGTITLPSSSAVKRYRIEMYWLGSVAVAINLPSLTLANGTNISNNLVPVNGTTSTSLVYLACIETAGNSLSTSFSFGSATLPTTPGTWFCRIMQVPQDQGV